MEILAVAIRLFTDADAALPPEHALHIGHELHSLVEEALLFQLIIERDEEDKTEGVGPKIA
jgi:hypothetical protein